MKTTTTSDIELSNLESQLDSLLKPVAPPRNIMKHIQHRIRFADRSEVRERLRDWRNLFFVFGGVMSGMLLLITLARALYTLTERKA